MPLGTLRHTLILYFTEQEIVESWRITVLIGILAHGVFLLFLLYRTITDAIKKP